MAMKRKNLPEVVPELFEHEQFGQFRFIKDGEKLWFVGVDLCRALGYANSRDALAKHVDAQDKRPDVAIRYVSSNGVVQNRKVTLVNESGMYMLIFGSQLPAAKKFTRWVTNEVLPSIRKYGFYRVQQKEQDKIYVEVIGEENFNMLKAKFPEVDFEIHHVRLGAERLVDCVEDTVHYYHVKLKPDDYEKISRDPLSLRYVDRFIPGKKRKSLCIRPTIHAMASES